jgi:NO-binding membrane sensor protein with MHYT domain
MKNLHWLIAILLPIIGLAIPEFSDPDQFTLVFANLAGLAGGIAIVVEGLKSLLKYNENSWKHLPVLLSFLVGIILSFLGWWLEFGMFIGQQIVWWQVIATGIVAAGLSNRWYDAEFAKIGLKLLWGLKSK